MQNALVGLVFMFLLGVTSCSKQSPPPSKCRVSTLRGAYLIEWYPQNLPIDPLAKEQPGSYVVNLEYIKDARKGSVAPLEFSANDMNTDIPLTLLDTTKYGGPATTNIFMGFQTVKKNTKEYAGINTLIFLTTANWTPERHVLVVVPKSFGPTDTLKLHFQGSGLLRLILMLNKEHHPDTKWTSDMLEIEIDFTKLSE